MIRTPSTLKIPTFLMNYPFTLDNKYPNNVLMNKDDVYDKEKAECQWLGLYYEVTEDALVYLLPSSEDLQDLPFVANIGAYLPHLEKDTILVSNYNSLPRVGEEDIGYKFFKKLNYEVYRCPFYFEGEADLKYIKDNIYVSPYGMRTELASHTWMRNKFNMEIISLELIDPKLYHLDCVLFPLDKDQVVVSTSIVSSKEIKQLEKYVNILDIPPKYMYNGWTNCVKIGNKLLHASSSSNRQIEKFYYDLGYEAIAVELDEFDKSGADLSCLMMHLNYVK